MYIRRLVPLWRDARNWFFGTLLLVLIPVLGLAALLLKHDIMLALIVALLGGATVLGVVAAAYLLARVVVCISLLGLLLLRLPALEPMSDAFKNGLALLFWTMLGALLMAGAEFLRSHLHPGRPTPVRSDLLPPALPQAGRHLPIDAIPPPCYLPLSVSAPKPPTRGGKCMAASYVFWFVHHGHEGQIALPVRASQEEGAWRVLARQRKQSLDYIREFFSLDAVEPLIAEECVLGIITSDEWGLSIEPCDCSEDQPEQGTA